MRATRPYRTLSKRRVLLFGLHVGLWTCALFSPALSWAQESERPETEESETSDEEGDFDSEEELFEVPEEDGAEGADEEEAVEEERRREEPLREMDKQEAKEAGFDFGGDARIAERTTGSFLAATGGLLAHGIGHWYVQEPRTAIFLAITEGVSVLLMGTGLAVNILEPNSTTGTAYAGTAFHVGAGLFGTSYLIDIIGSVQGGTLRMPDNGRIRRNVAIRAGYEFTRARGYPQPHHFFGMLDYDVGPLFGEAGSEQEFQFDASSYLVDLGVRFWRGGRDLTYVYTTLYGEFFQYRAAGKYSRLTGELRLGTSLDLGLISPHLEQVAVGADAGYGLAAYRIPVLGSSGYIWGGRAPYIPVEIYTHFNLSQRLNVRMHYEKRPGAPLQATRRLGGVGGIDFFFDTPNIFDLELGAEFGGGFALSGALVLQLWE